MTDTLSWLSAAELATDVRRGQISASEVAAHFVRRVDNVNPAINAIVDFDREQVLADARALDAKLVGGESVGPLHGVPFTIKDLTAVAGRPLTFGMVPMKDNIAEHDAVIVRRLKAAGGLYLGKTNTPESGYYGGTDNHLFGPTHNPWKRGYSAGGSSGGAAAAVAAGLGPLAEGSDGAGSVRIPASLCGAVGLKPSTGRVPQTILGGRFYHWAYHGPITRTVEDNALMLGVVAGPDESDPLSLPASDTDYVAETKKDIAGWRIAWSPDLGFAEVDPEVAAICAQAVRAFEDLGARVEEATPGWGDPEEAMWHGIWVPGFAAEHDMIDWDEWQGQVDDNLVELMREGERLTGVDVGRADLFRGRMWDTFSSFMQDYDLLVSPTLCEAAHPLGQFAPGRLAGASLRTQLLGWLMTYPYNMLTTPAVTVPAGFTSDGRPVGLQIAGRLHADAAVLRAAANFERARPWADRIPEL
ncbi:aspartyl-tRNA(Asn) amidotransferase subunit A [Rhodococcus aetherivorans]|uniref:amidase n=1 Tax=Rhodococcus aetherivorans TaxID=191292 RepID=A0ABQ0YFV9_9NOCA|nr:amidase family protein [Rhodococcus aetherivorans]ETT26291.1 Amidase [Rhodococcus rhodochrous ATCC 21198]KDE10159.1 amidase [Rhodococcus aetherivorans]MDV6295972.1 amidase family protein [Rhodococcus aetherivorans]NGP28279.1 amidase [Rhodococcus aetherivorans]GES35427.1 aspartyl-tRNA(Asn) amidotransferase subunit A [Rhodococcus aetherivorans]